VAVIESVARMRQRRKETRPAELIEAAIYLFAEKGFAATRLEDVARQAGVSKGTAYLYFPTKEALFKAAIRDILVTKIEMGERDVEEWQGSSEELLRHTFEYWAQVIRSRHGGLLKLIVAEAKNFPDLANYYLTEVAERGRRLMTAVLTRGVESGEFRPIDIEATAMVIGCPLAFRSIWAHSLGCFEQHPIADDRFFETYFDLMLAGLRTGRMSDRSSGASTTKAKD
jgi:AcrR family transcriptional regulator